MEPLWAACQLVRPHLSPLALRLTFPHSLDVIKRLNYTAPTSIQAQAIPAIMSGRDIIGVAKTGSGKTIAFLLPMFRHIKDQRPLEQMEGPIAIVMTPTRELAVQIHRDCKPFLKVMNLRVSFIVANRIRNPEPCITGCMRVWRLSNQRPDR
jgi:superfamily II DNA/RNA helicase